MVNKQQLVSLLDQMNQDNMLYGNITMTQLLIESCVSNMSLFLIGGYQNEKSHNYFIYTSKYFAFF